MYLAIMLIIVSALVIYNEINKQMNIAEIMLLVITFIAIIRASLNYIQIDTTESFANSHINNRRRKHHKNKQQNTTILNSKDSDEYLDTEKFNTITSQLPTTTKTIYNNHKINQDAVNQVNSLLGLSKFDDLITTTTPQTTIPITTNPTITFPLITEPAPTQPNNNSITSNSGGIESIFKPQIIIGNTNDNGSSKWNSVFTNDGMTFNNTMAPSSNLWNTQDTNHSGIQSNMSKTDSINWTQNMTDYNYGRWNPQLYKKPSDYVDYNTPYGTSTLMNTNSHNNTNNNTQTTNNTNKKCGKYDDMDERGELIIKNYTESKKWYPGYTYIPPIHWDVPQRHISVCQPPGANYQKLTGLVDRGLPMNVLELNPDGSQADTESSVNLTNVGSVMPRFNYQEQPFSKPYI